MYLIFMIVLSLHKSRLQKCLRDIFEYCQWIEHKSLKTCKSKTFFIQQKYGQLSKVTYKMKIRNHDSSLFDSEIFAQMPKFAVGNIEKRKRQNRRVPPSNVLNQIICQKGQVFSQVGRLRRVGIPYTFLDEFDEEVANINNSYSSSAAELPKITKVITGAKMFSILPLYFFRDLEKRSWAMQQLFWRFKNGPTALSTR